MICAGIDAGSRAIKVALLDAKRGLTLATASGDQGTGQARRADRVLARALRRARLRRRDIAALVATGYGREIVPGADAAVTEITCQARGVSALVPAARTVIDIGGQDSKLLRLDTAGRTVDFVLNDRCAAGTGRFLEVVADRLELRLSELGRAAARSRAPANISSMCVVFAETEIVGLLAAGAAAEDIVAGVCHAIAERVSAMAGGQVRAPVVLTGGVARIAGMDRTLSAVLRSPVTAAPQPQYTGALGAALIAADRFHVA